MDAITLVLHLILLNRIRIRHFPIVLMLSFFLYTSIKSVLSISHYSGIYHISLSSVEEYQANPAHLIMWDKRIEPTRLFPDHLLASSPRSSLRQYTFIKNIVDSSSFQPKIQYMNRVLRSLRNFTMGTHIRSR
jgi:hypothetical protein